MSKEKLPYIKISSSSNANYKHLHALRTSKKARMESQEVAVFDHTSIQELSLDFPIKKLFSTDEEVLASFSAQEKYQLSHRLDQTASGLRRENGVAATFSMPIHSDHKIPDRLLVLDGVADPGNLGTMIRTALAAGFTGAILTPNCCDPYNDKVLRASKGLALRFWYSKKDIPEIKELIVGSEYQIVVADLKGKPLGVIKKKKIALIVGAEGSGISQDFRSLGMVATLPMAPGVESLNVATAAAILMYRMSYE